jgi:hypothetical protein
MLEALGLPVPAGLDGVSLLGFARGETPAVPPDAWSYASASNLGLALRSGSRKYFLDDTAWVSRRPSRLAWLDLDRDPLELARQPVTPAQAAAGVLAAPFARAAAHWRRASGLWIEVDNRTDRAAKIALDGSNFLLDSFKTIDERLRLSLPKMGHAVIEIAPHATAPLRFTRRPSGRVRVTLLDASWEGSVTLVPTDIDSDVDLVWTGQRWTVPTRKDEGPIRLSFRWRGEVDPAAPLPPLPPSDATAKQLRALGYLN